MENYEPDKPKHYADMICLNFFQKEFEEEISNYALVKTENLHDEDNDAILMVYYFERGIDNHLIVLFPDGSIKTIDEDMPVSLLSDIHNCIVDANGRFDITIINKLGKVIDE